MARQNHAKNAQSKAAPQLAETPKPEANSAKPEAISAKPAAVSAPPATVAQPETSPVQHPSPSQIAQRAYELFVSQGGHHGHHEEHWIQAERELSLNR